MQRIDENTYIDDTLVTCAEYQLFINQMRLKQKYYQPDHWVSHKFPEGHARNPILGVRYGDAQAFCEWLTKREADEWRYRLPTSNEARENPLRTNQDILSLGYWVIAKENQTRFTWIGSFPDNPQGNYLDIDRALRGASNRAFLNDPDHISYQNAIRRGRKRADADLQKHLSVAYIARDTYKILDRALDRAHIRARVRNYDFTRNRNLSRALELAGDRRQEPELDLYNVITTLQERIAGRSPAFEGIRLIKERIK